MMSDIYLQKQIMCVSHRELSFYLFIFLFAIQPSTAYTAGITQDGNAVVGGSFTIECVTDSVVGVIQITDPSGNLAANCLIPSGTTSNCVLGTDPNYSSSQVIATKTTSVNIGVTVRATHEGPWTCTKAGDIPFTTSVTILTVPASITELTPAVTDFEVTTSTSKTMAVVVECAYPSAQIDWEFVTETSASTGISPTRNTCTDMGLTGGSCSDAAAKTFHCDFTVTETSTASLSAGKYKLKANLYMDGEVTSTGISVELSTILTIPAVPASITELTPAVTDFEVETSTSKTMTAVVECAYPSAQIDWEFVTESSASTGISPTRKACTDMGLTGGACSDAAAKTFCCVFTVTETSTASLSAGKYKLKANLYMDGEVTSTGISVELTPIVTI